MKHFKREIKTLAKKADVKIGKDETEKILHYYNELSRWNKHINLISKNDLPDFPKKHLYPVFILSRYLKGSVYIIDYGAGGGIVGIPLSILLEEANVYLLESRIKKCVFLKHIVKTLSLNAVVLEGRENKYTDFYHKFDYVLVRGLKIKKEMFPFLKDDGSLIHIGKTKAHPIKGTLCQNKTINGVHFLWCKQDKT